MQVKIITPQLLKQEFIQRKEEGCDVRTLDKDIQDVASLPEEEGNARAEGLFRKLEALSPAADFPYREPGDLDEIKAARPGEAASIGMSVDKETLLDRTHGAWLGRCAGCMLGKPVEGWHRERIERVLRKVNAYPLDDYFPPEAREVEELDNPLRFDKSVTRGGITYSVRDDDTDYTLLALHSLESVSRLPASADFVNEWLDHLPYRKVYSAERAAYRNFVNGVMPPLSATFVNPYREWIGAQIRADFWGYAFPGEPERAAEVAFQDARISHVKNGIYGEMFVAAVVAAAFAADNIEEILQAGLSQIPAESRLAEAVRRTIEWSNSDASWERTWERVIGDYGNYHPVHTIHNAAFVVLALLHGQKDFTRTVSIAVMCGLDTDCNGATAGSVVGAMLGHTGIAESWKAPLNDTLMTALAGMTTVRISDLAARTRKAAATVTHAQ